MSDLAQARRDLRLAVIQAIADGLSPDEITAVTERLLDTLNEALSVPTLEVVR